MTIVAKRSNANPKQDVDLTVSDVVPVDHESYMTWMRSEVQLLGKA